MRVPQVILVLYAIAAIANVIANFMDWETVQDYSKPLLMPLLLAFVYESSKGAVTILILLLSLSLILSWGGDVSLMYEGNNYFILGLTLFLLAHLSYTYLFLKSIDFKIRLRPIHVLPMVLYSAVFLSIILPKSGPLTIPVTIYALVITIMALGAMARFERTTRKSFNFVFIGSLIFVLSDSLLAYSKFSSSFTGDGALVMLTYVLAQYLIVDGVLSANAQSR